MADNDVIKKIRGQFPFPWRTIAHHTGLVQVLDATGKEVSLFALTDLACHLTVLMAMPKQAEQEQQA